MDTEPYYVLAASWPSPNACGVSLSVYPNGTLKDLADSWSYDQQSGIHGLAMGQRDRKQLLYSADLNGDSIWTHAVDKATGKVKKLGSLKMTKSGMHPRHLAAHPNGTCLYVVMEAENALHQIRLDETGVAVKDSQSYSLIPTGRCYPRKALLPPSPLVQRRLTFFPPGEQSTNYWSANVMISSLGRYLWATSRGQRGTRYNGYISCFLLAEDGTIIKKMFMIPTSSGGVTSNAITAAFWSDQYAVLTEATNGKIEIFKLGGKTNGEHGAEYTTADSVAKIVINDGGCCANGIWYS